MRLRRTLCSLMLAAAALTAAHAETLISTDFSKGSQGWVINADARLLDPATSGVSQVLGLTTNEYGQTGVAWTEIRRRVPSFSFIADVRVRHQSEGYSACPADGVALSFAPVETDAVGNGGGGLGLFGLEQFTAFEINTYHGQGLGEGDCTEGGNVTFAYDVVNPDTDASRGGERGTPETGGAKIGQVLPPDRMRIVNDGWYRYQWNVAEDGTMAVYVTGLEEHTKQFQKVKVLEVKFPNSKAIDFEGRWGLSAATGGAVQHTDVLAARIDAPMIDPL
jgi:hypothetical protein